ncbi:MAG: polyprenyl synthetase family protein [Thermodesulfobacteriota bacterium]|nr:polyprenyl synthetase family protein [Thermodesulfobacteriota bacterium]
MNLEKKIDANKLIIDKWIRKFFSKKGYKSDLQKAMIYSVMNGGKRIRPFIICSLSKYLKIKQKNYLRLAIAIELVHCYSLIHDDLPSMDNDRYRRGKLTTHIKFDEATAILAGNSLFSLAIELIADKKTHLDEKVRINLIEILASYSGISGLTQGQSYDLKFENQNPNKEKIINMYNMKTSKLFEYCLIAPYIMSKSNKNDIKDALHYGRNFGLIYQITDDILDFEGDLNKIGKTPKKDIKSNKKTLVEKIGKKKSLELCESLANECTNKNNIFGSNKHIFKRMIFHLIERSS